MIASGAQDDLSKRRYVYVRADGIYSNVKMDDRLCLLVIVGSDETGRKEVLAVVDGYRESEAFWLEVIEQMENQGLSIPPLLAVADGALVFLEGSGEEGHPPSNPGPIEKVDNADPSLGTSTE